MRVCVCLNTDRISGARSLHTDLSRNPPTDISPILVKMTHIECWEKRTFKKSFPAQTRAGVGLSGSSLRHRSLCQVAIHLSIRKGARNML